MMTLPLDELISNPRLVDEHAQSMAWDELLYDYERALDDDTALLNGLSDDQIHFKSAAKSFSIVEVLTHATEADRLFWSWVRWLATSQRVAIDPAALIPGGGARNDLALDQVRGEIEACRALARETIETLIAHSAPIDLAATTPHPYFGELNAKGWIYFMITHHGMHLRQCEAVIDTPGFPAGNSRQSLTPDEYLQPRERKTWLGAKQEARSEKRGMRSQKSEVRKQKTEAGSLRQSVKDKTTAKKKPAGQKKQSSRKTTAKR